MSESSLTEHFRRRRYCHFQADSRIEHIGSGAARESRCAHYIFASRPRARRYRPASHFAGAREESPALHGVAISS